MSFLSQFSIRTKIYAAFAIVLCATTMLGLFAVQRLTAVNESAAELRDNWMPSVQVLGTLSFSTTRYRQLEASYAIVPGSKEKAAERDKLNEEAANTARLFAEYARLVSSPEEAKLLDSMKQLWATYVKSGAAFMAAVDDGHVDVASGIYVGEMRATFSAFNKALTEDLVLNSNGAAASSRQGAEQGAAARTWIFGVLGGMLVVCLLIGVGLVRGISGPIGGISAAMARLAEDDLSVEIPGVGRGDEIGAMAGATQVFKEAAIRSRAAAQEQAEAQARRAAEDERVRRDAEAAAASEAASLVVGSIGLGLGRLADGDLTFRVETRLPDAYEKLRADLNSAIGQVQDAMRSIVTTTGAIQAGSSEIAQASDDLSRRTEQQAASLEQTAAALDEITATVRRAAEGASHAQRVAAETTADAERSGVVVQNTVQAMGEIEASARQISQIIGVIDEIAFQTNLLALNAGVEAARAGDAGRGLAVVASEVRALAQRSAAAAKEIKALIGASTRQVDQGVKLVGETGVALGRITGQVAQLDRAVAEIAAGAQEQATGLAQVNTAVNQMDQVTQQNAAMVEQSTAASHALSQEAAALAELTGRFKLGENGGYRARPALAEAAD